MQWNYKECDPRDELATEVILKKKVKPIIFGNIKIQIQPNILFTITKRENGQYTLKKTIKGGVGIEWVVTEEELVSKFIGRTPRKVSSVDHWSF